VDFSPRTFTSVPNFGEHPLSSPCGWNRRLLHNHNFGGARRPERGKAAGRRVGNEPAGRRRHDTHKEGDSRFPATASGAQKARYKGARLKTEAAATKADPLARIT